MSESDDQGPKAEAQARDERVKDGPNRYGYDPVLWPPRI